MGFIFQQNRQSFEQKSGQKPVSPKVVMVYLEKDLLDRNRFCTFASTMRIKFFLLVFCLLSATLFAQVKEHHMAITATQVTQKTGEIYRVDMDTIPLDFQHANSGDGYRTPRAYLGNVGSPSYSRIFFEQSEYPRFLFTEVYKPFFYTVNNSPFYNTTIPLTNITYLSGGSSMTKEERFKLLFAANANKKINVGANLDYMYNRGFYGSQAVDNFSYRLFGSYNSDRYQLHTFMSNSNLSQQESGGISDDGYITDPTTKSSKGIDSRSIPVYLDQAWSRVNGGTFFLTHRYNLGFSKTERVDTTDVTTFTPVSSIIHTFEYNTVYRRFISKTLPKDYFDTAYFNNKKTNDSTFYKSYRNTIALSLREGFNKFALFGLTAYITNEIRNYQIMDSTGHGRYHQQSTFVGGELIRQMGKTINYKANVELGVLGEDIGQFTATGSLETKLKIFKKEVFFTANGFIKNLNPGFYLNHYQSNHFWWNNSFNKERRVRMEGEIAIPEKKFSIKAGVENLQNYIYFNNQALPAQESNNIQILSGSLSKDFKMGILHLDNEIHGQFSSNQNVIPLPALTLYHNFYILTKLAKVLSFQIGADLRFNTEYYALGYQPATSQFYTQDKIKIGNYPLVSGYVNMHLKRARFFVMYYHASKGLAPLTYFSTPHYPINPSNLKIGISWNLNN